MEVFFSTNDNFKFNIINILKEVKKELYIMAFEINDKDVINQINELINNNVNVSIIVNYRNNVNLVKLLNKKCKLYFITNKLFHHKNMLIDEHIIVTGSSNLHINSVSGKDTEYIIKLTNSRDLVKYHKDIFNSYINNNIGTENEFYKQNNIIENIWYSKYTNLMEKILFYIDEAKESILIMHFWLTSKIILDKLIEKSKIINIKVLVDKRSYERDREQYKNSNSVEYLYLNNVDVKIIDTKLFHYKIILIDNNIILTGSQNLYNKAFLNHYEDISLFKSNILNKIFNEHYNWLINNYNCYSYKEWELNLFCKKNNINKDNICIVGSHILSKLNLRQSNDVDFILTSNERNRLKLPKKNKSCGKYIEIVSYNWHPKIKDNDFITNSECYNVLSNGFKICKLQMLVDRKKRQNRAKDKKDLILINNMIEYNFSGFIWGPSIQFINEIFEYINEKYPVLHYYNYKFTDKTLFEKTILDIYTTDDIDPKKVKDVKIKNMLKHPLIFTYFKFYIKTPNFRKKGTGNNISRTVESIKKHIRSSYKSKVKNYIHDIIIHISDNYEQTRDIENIMKKYSKNMTNEFINLKYFLQCNFKNNVFNRADMLVRKYSIEQYLKDEKYDFCIYKKMQKKRIRQNPENSTNTFKNLINSIKKNRFNNDFPIKYSKKYLLRDGSHRLSYLYMSKVTFIPIEYMKWDNHGPYSIIWFKQNNFSQNVLDIINKEILKLEKYIL